MGAKLKVDKVEAEVVEVVPKKATPAPKVKIKAPPKTTSGMGDLVVVMPSKDDDKQNDDDFLPPGSGKPDPNIKEAEELYDTDTDKSDINQNVISAETKRNFTVNNAVIQNEVFETGEWFESDEMIEGNPITLKEAKEIFFGPKPGFDEKSTDVSETTSRETQSKTSYESENYKPDLPLERSTSQLSINDRDNVETALPPFQPPILPRDKSSSLELEVIDKQTSKSILKQSSQNFLPDKAGEDKSKDLKRQTSRVSFKSEVTKTDISDDDSAAGKTAREGDRKLKAIDERSEAAGKGGKKPTDVLNKGNIRQKRGIKDNSIEKRFPRKDETAAVKNKLSESTVTNIIKGDTDSVGTAVASIESSKQTISTDQTPKHGEVPRDTEFDLDERGRVISTSETKGLKKKSSAVKIGKGSKKTSKLRINESDKSPTREDNQSSKDLRKQSSRVSFKSDVTKEIISVDSYNSVLSQKEAKDTKIANEHRPSLDFEVDDRGKVVVSSTNLTSALDEKSPSVENKPKPSSSVSRLRSLSFQKKKSTEEPIKDKVATATDFEVDDKGKVVVSSTNLTIDAADSKIRREQEKDVGDRSPKDANQNESLDFEIDHRGKVVPSSTSLATSIARSKEVLETKRDRALLGSKIDLSGSTSRNRVASISALPSSRGHKDTKSAERTKNVEEKVDRIKSIESSKDRKESKLKIEPAKTDADYKNLRSRDSLPLSGLGRRDSVDFEIDKSGKVVKSSTSLAISSRSREERTKDTTEAKTKKDSPNFERDKKTKAPKPSTSAATKSQDKTKELSPTEFEVDDKGNVVKSSTNITSNQDPRKSKSKLKLIAERISQEFKSDTREETEWHQTLKNDMRRESSTISLGKTAGSSQKTNEKSEKEKTGDGKLPTIEESDSEENAHKKKKQK